MLHEGKMLSSHTERPEACGQETLPYHTMATWMHTFLSKRESVEHKPGARLTVTTMDERQMAFLTFTLRVIVHHP